MESIWKWLLGDEATRQGTPELHWANMPESWVVFVLLLAVGLITAFVFALYRREIETCPPPIRTGLALLRWIVLMILVVMFLRPSVVYRQVNVIKSGIAILRDCSLSFSKKDAYADPDQAAAIATVAGVDQAQVRDGHFTRTDLVDRAFGLDEERLTRALRSRGFLRVFDFADSSGLVATVPALEEATNGEGATAGESAGEYSRKRLPRWFADGRATDMWQALRDVLADSARLSAIVLATDGQDNGGEDPLAMAERAGELGIPIFVIGVGDPSRPMNRRVAEVYLREKVPIREPFEIEALIDVEGSADGSIDVALRQHRIDPETGEDLPGPLVELTQIEVPENGGRVRVSFEHHIDETGLFAYSVSIDGVDGESDQDDNTQMSQPVEVVDQKVRVLLIAGEPTWEYQQLQRLFQRDDNIQLSCWLQSMDEDRPQEGDIPITRLPNSITELGEYNVIMMIDPNPAEFEERWVESLKQFCKQKAGGVFFMAGPSHTAMFLTLNRLSEIRDLLPVEFGDAEYIDTTQVLQSTVSANPQDMRVVRHNVDHPVMSFVSNIEENLRIWGLMPGNYWSFPAVAAKPAAQVLMERVNVAGNGSSQPLLVAGRYGSGNVVYMGFNGTWRWRRVGLQAQYFDRFWVQVVSYLVETRSLQGKRRGIIDSDRRNYELGDEVVLVARALNERFEGLTVPELGAVITDEDGESRPLPLIRVPGQEGEYEARFVAFRTGRFQVDVNLPGAEGEAGIEPIVFQVTPPGAETRATWLDEKRLREMAKASGGAYLPLSEIGTLAELVPNVETTSEYSSPPQPVWDLNTWTRMLFFGLPFVLLTVEWAVRKRYRLL